MTTTAGSALRTRPRMSAPLRPAHRKPPVTRTVAFPGAASLGLRAMLQRRPCAARVIAVFPSAVYIQLAEPAEPRVVALVATDAVRLPNAIVVAASTQQEPFAGVTEADPATVGDGTVETGSIGVRVRRWWDPIPVLGPLSPARLRRGGTELGRRVEAATWGLLGHDAPVQLAERCAVGDLAGAVDAAERIVGLGPGLTPSGDDALAGLLLALRLLGGAVPDGGRAVWLADWLGVAVTTDAGERTTALAATLLHCAARGQASAESAGVLRGIAGQEPLGPAVRRLTSTGHTSGADLAWGLLAGCRAASSLAGFRV